jgi:hypothetical protein
MTIAQTGGLTPFALAFMLLSMGSVTTLMLWCFYRIFRSPQSYSDPDLPREPEPERRSS